MINTLKKNPNAISVTYSLIKKLSIPVSRYTVIHDLEEHPDYPSLLAVSDCLTSWNVQNQAVQLDKENCNIDELPLPFIAHLKIDGGQLMLINEIHDNVVHFSNENELKGRVSRDEFLAYWDGILLYSEKHEASGEPDYKNALIKGISNQARLPFLITIVLLIVLSAIDYHSITWAYAAILLMKLSGIVVSCVLLMHSINFHNPFIQNLCSLGKKNDCNAILKSEAAKVTSWLSWSEVGMFYFSGTFIYLLLSPSDMGFISWLNLFCLPYTFYSIGYQIRVKSWCILCCSIQAILWLEAIVFLSGDFSFYLTDLNLGYSTFALALLCFFFPIAFWSFIKPLLLKTGQIRPLKQQLKKFKYNSILFNQLLSTQTRYSVPDDLMPVVLGNPNAETIITMVSNPFCGPCATAHQQLETWLSERDDLQLKVVFTTADHDDDSRTKVARHVAALSKLENRDIAKKALNEWYSESGKKYETWAQKFPVELDNETNTITKKQKEWCKLTEISFTPTIFVNGYKLMSPYQLEDIKYLLD